MIGIISDTHENIPAIRTAVAMLKERGPALVVHCGDIISPPVLAHFSGLPMRFVFGNNDGEREGLQAACARLGFGEIRDELSFEADGKRFLVYHGTRTRRLQGHIDAQEYDYVLTGHTHVTRDERVGRSRVINPGALFLCDPFSFALLDPVLDKLEMVEFTL